MPRVSEAHRTDRRRQILVAAAQCFARDGFHATSMADVIATAGLSAGAVYGYFRSKEELIAAVIDVVLANARDVFGRLLADGASPSPATAVATVIDGIVEGNTPHPFLEVDITRIAVQAWAEALRNPAIGEQADRAYRQLRDYCTEVARRWQVAGNLPADARPEQLGAAMLGLIQGLVLQRLLLSDTSTAGYTAGVKALLAPADPSISRRNPPADDR